MLYNQTLNYLNKLNYEKKKTLYKILLLLIFTKH